MNETIKNLIERRSCRKFKEEQIKDEELNEILLAGEYAPTGMGMQSPKMVVLQNKETIEKLSKLNAKIMGRDIDPFYGAPTVIVVLADKTRTTYIEDGSLVIGNLITRIIYEFLLILLVICRNTSEMNSKLGKNFAEKLEENKSNNSNE